MRIIKVADLIEFLQKQQQDLPVAYKAFSEHSLLDLEDIEVENLCKPRPDGWVSNFRPDKEMQKYLVFPGN